MKTDVRIGNWTTPQCARFRAPLGRTASDTPAPILTRTSPNCANIRIRRSRPKFPQAALKMTQKIFHCPKVKIPWALKTSASFARIPLLSTLSFYKMGKIKLSTAASITSSPLNALPKILTNGNKIHHSSLAKVFAERGQTTRSCWTERTSKLCRKECASQVFKMTTWWQCSEITIAKSRRRFEGWLHRKPDRLGSKWTSGFMTKKSVRVRT